MDPEEALRLLRSDAREALGVVDGDAVDRAERLEDLAAALAERFQALDGWLTRGGFAPRDWQPSGDEADRSPDAFRSRGGDPALGQSVHRDTRAPVRPAVLDEEARQARLLAGAGQQPPAGRRAVTPPPQSAGRAASEGTERGLER